MKRLLIVIAVGLTLLATAAPAAAQERGDVCEDPSADPPEFICGRLTVTLASDADATIHEVIARSGPEAAVAADSPDGPTYLLDVPVGEELRLLDAFAADAAVEDAFLVQVGTHTGPTTTGATMPDTSVGVIGEGNAIPAGLVVGAAMLVVLMAVSRLPLRR